MPFLKNLRRSISRIWIRLLAFNLLLLFLPVAGLFYFEIFEQKLLEAQETSMVQQGRLLAAALAASGTLNEQASQTVLKRLNLQSQARLRVVDQQGILLADTGRFGPRLEAGAATTAREAGMRERALYRLGLAAFRVWDKLMGPPQADFLPPEYYRKDQPLLGPEIAEALQGRYGAAWRVSEGQRSVHLYSAIPIQDAGRILGAVLVTQSTFRVLEDLYEVRFLVFRLILVSAAVALLLSLLVAATIARPLRQLQKQALACVQPGGLQPPSFQGSDRLDEIGDLSRALAIMSRRLKDRIAFIESFAADVAHEFKNPLASIRTASEMASQIPEEPERQRFLGMVQTEVARMEALLAAVRQVSWIDSQIQSELYEPVDLKSLLENLADGFQRRHKTVQVRMAAPSIPLFARASQDRLVQVFENILDNAVSFSPVGSTIDIELSASPEESIVRISDRGPGMAPEHLDRIFLRFFSYRPDAREGPGYHAGLGLSIVKAIVEGLGGTVEARNRKEGGSVFEVRLPLATA